MVTSDGFDSVPANEADSGAIPPFPRLEERPAAFWKNHKKNRKGKLSRKETALEGGSRSLAAADESG